MSYLIKRYKVHQISHTLGRIAYNNYSLKMFHTEITFNISVAMVEL